MLKQTSIKRVLFVRRHLSALLAVIGVFSLALVNLRTPQMAYATAASTINFQARLQSAAGAIVPDGNYNVQFKIYSGSSCNATSGSGCTQEWTESYLNSASQGLTVRNGYLSAGLGSITAFPSSVPWGQQLWLSMNIGGTSTGTVSWDGEMKPYLSLTAVPYAFQAAHAAQSDQLSNVSNGNTSTLTFQGSASGHGDQNFIIQDQGAAGTYNLLTQNQSDARYIQLQGATPGTAQTGNFNINGTGIAATLQATTINGGSSNQFSVSSSGGVDINDTSDTAALTIENNSGTFFRVDTSGNRVNIGDTTGTLCSGRLCVAQGISGTGGSTYTNSYNVENINVSTNSNTFGQSIVINDTSGSGINNTNTGLKIDFTGSSNTSSGYYGVVVKAPSGTNAGNGNLIQLQNGSTNVFKVSDGGNMLLHTMGSYANAFEVQDSSGYDVLNVSTNGDYVTLGNITTTSGQGVAGKLQLADGSADGYAGTLQLSGTLGSNQTYNLPTVGGTLCTTSTCAASSGSGSYIQNGTSPQTSANFNIDGTGTAATFNATSGYQINGVAGASTTCSGGEVLGDITVVGGIVTGGTCAINGGGVSPTLQDGYNNSSTTDPQIQLSGTKGVTIYDAATTVGTLFQIADNAGITNYFKVTSSGATAATFNATSGYQINGVAGASTTCSGGQFLQNQAVVGGIVTGGTCAAGGVTTIGALDGGTANAAGATISGTTLYLQSASASFAGLVNTAAQTFAGAKTFTGDTLVKDTSTSAFRVTDASSNILFNVDTSTGTITIGNSASGAYITFDATNGLVANGSARHTKTINLTPEYAGAVLDAAGDTGGTVNCSSNNNGTMTSGYDSTNAMNFYQWTSSQSSSQCYDVVVQVPIPSDFAGWAANPLSFQAKSSNASNATYALQVLKSNGSADTTFCASDYCTPTTVSTSWANETSGSSFAGSGYTAGSYFTIRIRATAKSSATLQLGNISLSYKSSF